MQYFKNSTDKNNKFPKLSDQVYYFKGSKEGADAITGNLHFITGMFL